MKLQSGALGVMVCIAVSGCGGGGDQLTTYPVTGVVTYNGSAVEGASVGFVPNEEGKPSAFGRTEADGSYTLTTYESGDGAPAGSYTVTVTKFDQTATESQGSGNPEDGDYVPPPDNPAPTPPPKSLVPEKYNSARTSDLTHEISSGTNAIDLELVD